MKINLTKNEIEIFNILQTAAKKNASTEIRVAGGWVRDKLLGLESNDIDIAINNLTGRAFAELFVDSNNKKLDFSLIESNPEQSKHLETTIIKLCGISIDLVNLRCETYSDSRIPTIIFGTPEQDALRRDLTINSLFYNITDPDNMFIEDFVGGISDLQNKIAKTPLDPVKTFLDDPLRILRVIRFCSRFDLVPDTNIIKAANRSDVQNAFKLKISKERIWSELAGTGNKRGFINGPNILKAIQLVCDFGFRDILFYPDPKDKFLNEWDLLQNNQHHDLPVWGHTFLALKYMLTNFDIPENKDDVTVRVLSLIMHDLGKLDSRYRQIKADGTNSFHGHQLRSAQLANQVLFQLSAPKEIRQRVIRLISEHCRFMGITNKSANKVFRKIMKDMESDWVHLVEHCCSDAYGKNKHTGKEEIRNEFDLIKEKMSQLLLEQKNVTTVIRPISGFDLINIGIKPGIEMGEIFKALDMELLEKPDMSKEEAIEFVKRIQESKSISEEDGLCIINLRAVKAIYESSKTTIIE